MVTAYCRGHLVVYADKWIYADTGEELWCEETGFNERPCTRCGKMPTPEGYDACLGYIEGATAVCCGHGVEQPILIRERQND
jgi:hypothetical protein